MRLSGEAWRQRRLNEVEVVTWGVDGVYGKAGLEREKGRPAEAWHYCNGCNSIDSYHVPITGMGQVPGTRE